MTDTGPWVNVALSHAGLAELIGADPGLTDEAFSVGLAARSALLGDEGPTEDWVVGSASQAVHILVIVAWDGRCYPPQGRAALIRLAQSAAPLAVSRGR